MRYRLAQRGTVFSTRERGAEVRAEIEALLRRADAGEPLVLDFGSVELISFSFADELVGRLLSDRAAGNLDERVVVLANVNDEVRAPIERSLARRRLVGASLEDDGVRLLDAPGHLQATFDAALDRGEFRTTELAADLGVSVSACNNRLKPLVASGLLTRERRSAQAGGREFVYRVPSVLRRAPSVAGRAAQRGQG